jgi:hypothetical protein
MLLRWAGLIQIHGSQTAALEALLRDADELVKLKRAVKWCGLKPEHLLMESMAVDDQTELAA